MREYWRIGGLLAVVAFILAGCTTLSGFSFSSPSDSASLKDSRPSPSSNQKAGGSGSLLSGEPREGSFPQRSTTESRPGPKVDLYQQVVDHATKLYDEGLTALLENKNPQAEVKFKEALTAVAAAQEKYPEEKIRLHQFYLTLKKDIEEAQKDKLPPVKEKEAGEGSIKPEPVLLVSPEDLEKLASGEKPQDTPRQVNSDLPVVFNDRVERFLQAYQTVRRGNFYEGLARMGRYRPYIQKILKEKGLPQDLIYVGLIESAFNPHVLSRARALGIWQFIPGTGRIYRLRQDFWIDERKDFEKSTEAAANYLKELYNRFGDWPLALAGYNAGEGRVEWALRRSKVRDYWQLRLPRETKLYVPAIYAAITLAKNLEEYGFKDLHLEPPLEYEKVSVPDAIDLKIIADCAGVESQLIYNLNPELLRWCTPPGVNYEVKIPLGTRARFQEKYAQIPKDQWVSWRTHKVRSGETMGKIGKHYGIPAATLAKMNRLKSEHRIRAGQILMIPVPWGAPIAHQSPSLAAAKVTAPSAAVPKAEAVAPVKTEAKLPEISKEIKPD